jgi:hypothetical protein
VSVSKARKASDDISEQHRRGSGIDPRGRDQSFLIAVDSISDTIDHLAGRRAGLRGTLAVGGEERRAATSQRARCGRSHPRTSQPFFGATGLIKPEPPTNQFRALSDTAGEHNDGVLRDGFRARRTNPQQRSRMPEQDLAEAALHLRLSLISKPSEQLIAHLERLVDSMLRQQPPRPAHQRHGHAGTQLRLPCLTESAHDLPVGVDV